MDRGIIGCFGAGPSLWFAAQKELSCSLLEDTRCSWLRQICLFIFFHPIYLITNLPCAFSSRYSESILRHLHKHVFFPQNQFFACFTYLYDFTSFVKVDNNSDSVALHHQDLTFGWIFFYPLFSFPLPPPSQKTFPTRVGPREIADEGTCASALYGNPVGHDLRINSFGFFRNLQISPQVLQAGEVNRITGTPTYV